MNLPATLSVSAVFAALLLSGCASMNNREAHGFSSSSLATAAREVHEGGTEIDAVLDSISSLIDGPSADLEPRFLRYCAAVDQLESLSAEVNARTAGLQAYGEDYFDGWRSDLAKIHDEKIKDRTVARTYAVDTNFERVHLGYFETRAAFVPVLSDLNYIRTTLATDLSAGSIDSIRGVATRAKVNTAPLRESLGDLESDFRALGVSVGPITSAE
jgi:hypothetical protein